MRSDADEQQHFATALTAFSRKCEVLLICVKDAQILELLQRDLHEWSVGARIVAYKHAPYQDVELFTVGTRLTYVLLKLL